MNNVENDCEIRKNRHMCAKWLAAKKNSPLCLYWGIKKLNMNCEASTLPVPKNFWELMAVFGLAHAINGWNDASADLLANKQML